MSALLGAGAAAAAVAGLVLVAGSVNLPGRAARPGTRGERGPRALRALVALGRRLRPRRDGSGVGDLQARVAAAGLPAGLAAREVMGAKLAGALGGGLLGSVLATATPGRLGFAVVLAAPVAGFLAPDLWLARLAGERARRMRRELPSLLDLLRVTVQAGASLPEALLSVGERSTGPLAAEFRAVGRQVALGVSLAGALGRMSERAPLPEVRALAGALERARRHGAPPADTLAAQARDARFALTRRVREDAARAGPKIQLVVALLLVPSVLLLVAAALVSALLGDSGGVVPV